MSEAEPHPPVSVGVDDVHAHAHHTGRRWLDLTIALSAIAISVISLFVAVQHGRTEEKLVAANSWPFLLYTSQYNEFGTPDAEIRLNIENQGVGPARVKSVAMQLNGHPVRGWLGLTRPTGVTTRDIPALVTAGLVSQNSPIGIIPARGKVELLGWHAHPGNAASLAALEQLRKRVTLRACYCSVLDECWVSDLKAVSTPQPVKVCPVQPDPFE